MENPCKRFLFISNVVISVLCVAAIACYFIFPLYRISFSATFTKELADAIADNVTVPDEVKIEKTSVNEKTAAEITRSVIKSLGEKGLKISFSQTFYTETFLAAFFEFACYKNVKEAMHGRALRAEELIDGAIDSFMADAESAVTEIITATATAAAKEVVKAQIGGMIKDTSGDSYDEFIADMGSDSQKIDTLIERIIKAILEENATVSSVTSVVLDSAEEVRELLLSNEKYAKYAENYDEDGRQYVKDVCGSVLSAFADESGKLMFKESLISMLLDALNQAIAENYVPEDVYEFTSAQTPAKTASQYRELTDELKQNIMKAFYNAADGKLPFIVTCCTVLIGALILTVLFMLFYPVLRTLSNVGGKDPGYSFFLPAVGGFFPYLFLAAIPSAAPAIFKWLLTSGIVSNVPAEVTTTVNAVSVKYFSGS
ncbi:MAG: hypothetical protein J5879_01910, partial [Clostridia bacterium]|nr:hypothetical protein [Clostridia bacterium]